MATYTCEAYLNQTSRFESYRDGDTLVPSAVGVHAFEADTPEQAASAVFTRQNLDNRPCGAIERSLSVGDVVMVMWPVFGGLLYRSARYACEPVGWRKL